MKITSINETVASIRSQLRNAYISFAEMTVPAVPIHTKVVRNGKTLVGYGFHSNGRYAQSGILNPRLIPRLTNAPSEVKQNLSEIFQNL